LAGQPGKIGVTALRREEAPLAAPDASRPILDAAETVATESLAIARLWECTLGTQPADSP